MTWYYRLNGGVPKEIEYNSEKDDIVYEAEFKAKGAKEIQVYYDNDPNYFRSGMRAFEMFEEVEPPLAFKSSGQDFERFMSQITDHWRSHVMGMVKQGMEKKQIDENKRIESAEMHKVIACLHGHMKSVKATQEFDNCFKAIKK
eukprot:215767_1